MENLRTFEEYKAEIHNAINVMRKAHGSKGMQKFLHILSLLDDVVHFDFKNIRNTFKNKEGYRKANDLAFELSLAIITMKDLEDRGELGLFYDIDRYGIDVNLILNYLEDPDFKKYVENDRRGKRSIEENNNVIEFLKRYKTWKGN